MMKTLQKIKSRLRLALHVLRGRPLVYRMIVGKNGSALTPKAPHAIIQECDIYAEGRN